VERRRKRRRPWRSQLAVKRTGWILGIPSSAEHARGLQAEEKALDALRYHEKKKTRFPGGRIIIEVNPTMHLSLDDQRGIDINVRFRVEAEGYENLPIQVQNWGTSRAKEEFRQKRICLVIIRPDEDKEKAKERVFEAISHWFSLEKGVPELI